MDDPDDGLSAGQALEYLLTDRLFLNPGDELLDDAEVYIRLKQGKPNLAQGVADILFREPAMASQAIKHRLELVTQVTEQSGWKAPNTTKPVTLRTRQCRCERARACKNPLLLLESSKPH